LSTTRIARLVEQEALDGATAHRPLDFLADVRKGVWSEIQRDVAVKVDAYRRNVQRAYIRRWRSHHGSRPGMTREHSSAGS
jgi:hypothetical protein